MNVKFTVGEKGLTVLADGKEIITAITGRVLYPGNHHNVLTLRAAGEWKASGTKAECGNLTLEIKPHAQGFVVRSTMVNTTGEVIRPSRHVAFEGELGLTVERGIVNRVLESNGNYVCEMESQIDTVFTAGAAIYESADNTALMTTGGDFVFGAATYDRYFSGVTFTREGHLTAYCYTEERPLQPGKSITSEAFYFAPCRECVSGLKEFARAVADYNGVPPITGENPTGYCTWYYYGNDISPRRILDNIEVLDARREELPVKYFQIDGGWFNESGLWEPDGTEFTDMKAMADEISAHGYVPGLWFAPFTVKPDSDFMKSHEDWFVKREDGTRWHWPSLDFTHPEVRKYMTGIFERATKEWGYRYLKIDTITWSLAPGVHHDPDATALVNYRLGLKTIRDAVPEGTFILACTAPIAPAMGLADAMRVSCDIFERWESLIDVFNASLKRYYYHGNYFRIDPDCLIIRNSDNEDDECFRLCTRTDEEVKTFVTAMAAAGGILMLSDKLPLLSDDKLSMISKLFPARQTPADPLDLMETYIPGVLDFGVTGRNRTVALINWSDTPREMSFEAEAGYVREFWSGETFYFGGGRLTAFIGAHCAKVFSLAPDGKAAVAGSDASLVMQSEWSADENGSRISGKRLKKGERVFVGACSPVTSVVGGTVIGSEKKDGRLFYEIAVTADKYEIKF